MGEIVDFSEEKFKYRLELEYRNPLQRIIIAEFQKMHSSEAEDLLSFSVLVGEFSKHLSDIIDAPEHEDIRVLARAKKYDEAANLVFTALGMERPPEEELKKAA